jgi:hypothetical protein
MGYAYASLYCLLRWFVDHCFYLGKERSDRQIRASGKIGRRWGTQILVSMRAPRTAGSSLLASLARRNDNVRSVMRNGLVDFKSVNEAVSGAT